MTAVSLESVKIAAQEAVFRMYGLEKEAVSFRASPAAINTAPTVRPPRPNILRVAQNRLLRQAPTLPVTPAEIPHVSGAAGRNVPTPNLESGVFSQPAVRAQEQVVNTNVPRASERDAGSESFGGKKYTGMGLGGLLSLSPEGAFLHKDPKFRSMYQNAVRGGQGMEELDALAHQLMQHQTSGGQINSMRARQIMQTPAYARTLQAMKTGSLRPAHYFPAKEKTAAGLLHAALTAAGGHFGTNLLGRSAHHGSNINEYMAHLGMQHGLLGAGTRIAPTRLQAIKSLMGPESMISYEMAHQAGSGLLDSFPNPKDRRAAIEAQLSRDHTLTEKTPVARDVYQAMKHEHAGTEPALASHGRAAGLYARALKGLSGYTTSDLKTPAQKAVGFVRGASPLVPFVAGDALISGGIPLGAVGHVGWNGIRQVAAETPIGKRVIKNEVASGLEGNRVSKLRELATDIGVSPAFLDARRAGLAAHENNPEGAQMMAGALKKMKNIPSMETFRNMF